MEMALDIIYYFVINNSTSYREYEDLSKGAASFAKTHSIETKWPIYILSINCSFPLF